MTCKEAVILAVKLAGKEQKELVVGKAEGRWQIMHMTDAASDHLSPSLIVTGTGIKYPEDEYLFSTLVAEGA